VVRQLKTRILITRAVFDEVLAYLRLHFDVEDNQSDVPFSADELVRKLADKDGALTVPTDRIDGALLKACPTLKAVCNIAVGYNNIDLDACTAAGVMACNTPGVLDDTTADTAWALMLATARRVVESDAWLRRGEWTGWSLQDWLGTDVHHANLGIIGMGRIGQAVGRRARGFDMQVIYHNRHRLPIDVEKAANAQYVSKEALLGSADFVVLTLPYALENHHYIAEAELALMKPTAILINIARGGLVDDAALVDALQTGRIAGAGLDVFENEPALNPAFIQLDNVVLTPHIGSATRATRLRMAMLAAQNLVLALTGGTPPNLLNPNV